MGNAERKSKSPGAGLFRAKQSGEIAARRRKVGCCLKGLTDTFLYDLMRKSKTERKSRGT